jgi:hypothetical protein
MFYKAIGYAVWKMAMAYMRQRYAHLKKPAAALTVAAAIGVIYVVTRHDE